MLRRLTLLSILLSACAVRSPAFVKDYYGDEALPVCVTPDEYLPKYEQCAGDFTLDLSGVDLGENAGGWYNGEFVYITRLDNDRHYVSCMADWECENPTLLPGGDMGNGCIDQAKCCDLGLVKN